MTDEQEHTIRALKSVGDIPPEAEPQIRDHDDGRYHGAAVFPWGDDGHELVVFPSGSHAIYNPNASKPV